MAKRAGRNLLYRSFAARQAHGIVLSREISHQCRDPILRLELCQSLLQKCRLTRSRTGYEADDKHSRGAELLSQSTRNHVILLQHIAANFDQSRLAHFGTSSSSSTSRANT